MKKIFLNLKTHLLNQKSNLTELEQAVAQMDVTIQRVKSKKNILFFRTDYLTQ